MKQIAIMEKKVVEVMEIKTVDMPSLEGKFNLNTQRTVLLGK